MSTSVAVIRTRDESLKRELAAALPKGFRLCTETRKSHGGIVFVDMDTMNISIIRELSGLGIVIAVMGRRDTELVMQAVSSGAYETLTRPLRREDLLPVIDELRALAGEMKQVIGIGTTPPVPTCAIVGHSAAIMQSCKKLARLAQVEAPVLITGETGSGKELVAESIAQLSSRFGKPFVVVNCAAVPENLLESELFGFEKGSFTGAVAPKEGMLRIADGGCVFFDEIGEMPLSLQGKLLRFLQTQTFYPLGSTREIQVNVRVISATNRDLLRMVGAGEFREDLYHRLSVTEIEVPPLRERKEDILPLVQFFINRYRQTVSREIRGITSAFMKRMTAHDWPGNIRELENIVRSGIALGRTPYLSTLDLRELETRSARDTGARASDALSSALVPMVREAISKKEKHLYEKVHAEVDSHLLEYVLSFTRENQSEAARVLGISRLTLRRRLRR